MYVLCVYRYNLFTYLFIYIFGGRISLCTPGCPRSGWPPAQRSTSPLQRLVPPCPNKKTYKYLRFLSSDEGQAGNRRLSRTGLSVRARNSSVQATSVSYYMVTSIPPKDGDKQGGPERRVLTHPIPTPTSTEGGSSHSKRVESLTSQIKRSPYNFQERLKTFFTWLLHTPVTWVRLGIRTTGLTFKNPISRPRSKTFGTLWKLVGGPVVH